MQLSDRFRTALAVSFDLHRSQERKGSGIPYVSHLLGVCSLVLEYGGSEDAAIAALLHDAVEDQGGLAVLARIEAEFGPRVAQIVRDCTDSVETPKPPWRARKEAYLAHLPRLAPESQLVSVADKLYNLRTVLSDYAEVGEALWSRFTGGREGTLWYYESLSRAYTLESRAVDEFRRTAAELARSTRELP